METQIKVAFYILPEAELKARDLYACRLVEKAYNSGRQVYIITPDFATAQNFDIQLWTFRDISFIPHVIYNNDPNSGAPVLIGFNAFPVNHNDVLINLTTEVPKFYTQFKHIIELVPNEETYKAAGRKRYQFYQGEGCEMMTHKV